MAGLKEALAGADGVLIATPQAGNAYLPEFQADYNERFGREPLSAHDAHRPVREDEDLERIFTWQEERKLSKNLTLHYKRETYLVEQERDRQRPASHNLTLRQKERIRAAQPRAQAPTPTSSPATC